MLIHLGCGPIFSFFIFSFFLMVDGRCIVLQSPSWGFESPDLHGQRKIPVIPANILLHLHVRLYHNPTPFPVHLPPTPMTAGMCGRSTPLHSPGPPVPSPPPLLIAGARPQAWCRLSDWASGVLPYSSLHKCHQQPTITTSIFSSLTQRVTCEAVRSMAQTE